KGHKLATAIITVLLLGVLMTVGYLAIAYRRSNVSNQLNSIAVMPFVNETGNAEVEYLSDGMTESLISSLSRLKDLNVKARSSVFRYKAKEVSAQTIARELNVQAILNGRFVQRGDLLTLSLELIDAKTENVIWSEQYKRTQADLVTLQSEIARDVSSKLQSKLSGSEQPKAETSTTNSQAYQLYLRGRFHWNKRAPQDLPKAVDYFQQAIALDPNYASAYAGLANGYMFMGSFNVAPPREVMPKGREAALKAISLDPQLPE